MSHCDRITLLLAEDGPSALRDDPEGQEHVAGCDDCYALLIGLEELEGELAGLPEVPIDPALRERVVAAARGMAAGVVAVSGGEHEVEGEHEHEHEVEGEGEHEHEHEVEGEVDHDHDHDHEVEHDHGDEDDIDIDDIDLDDDIDPSLQATDPEPTVVRSSGAEPRPARPSRSARVLRFVRRHPRPAIGAIAALVLAMVTVPTVFLVTQSGGEYGLYDSAPDRFVQLSVPAEAPPQLSWEEAPDRTATLPAIGQPQPGKSSVAEYDAGVGLDLLSDASELAAAESAAPDTAIHGLRGGAGGEGGWAGEDTKVDDGEAGGRYDDSITLLVPTRRSTSRERRGGTEGEGQAYGRSDSSDRLGPASGPASPQPAVVESTEQRQRRLEEEVSSDGVLALLGTTGSTTTRDSALVADLLDNRFDGGLDDEVGLALASASGSGVVAAGGVYKESAGAKGGDKDGDALASVDEEDDEERPTFEPEPTPEPIPDWDDIGRNKRETPLAKRKAPASSEKPEVLAPPADPAPSRDEPYRIDLPEQGDFRAGRDEDRRQDGLLQAPLAGQTEQGRWNTPNQQAFDTQAAQEYLADNRATDNVPFQRASGYWENQYVPGDPTLRRLHRRLTESDRTQLGLPGADAMLLDAASRQYSQPFDRPADSALAVYLHGDRRGVQGETRMRLQVGIQATQRGSGRRTAMNVGVVLDLRAEPDADDAAAIRSLLEALSQARDSGDTISLTVAGRPGGMVLPPGDFRYGPVTVALEELLSSQAAPTEGPVAGGPTLSLPAALRTAATSVQSIDDPSQPLGSSLVLLVSAGQLNGAAHRLSTIAHSSAVAGVPVSVVGVGDQADLPRLEEIALAGQGNRRLMSSPGEARDLVDRELTAVSHVVARAVRLRIKLAPGVKLVDVLGSERLDALRSDRVREAERSIDLRLSKNLGIQSDRGDDEEGIQIVVPTWYSGDAHVVLLDVVVPGPGPVAEVTVRYKDLVHLRNGVARSSLRLTHDASPPGPLEHNVVRNVLAMDLSEVLASAAQLLADGREGDAAQTLRAFVELVRGLQVEEPALYADPEVDADLEMVAEYLALLDGTALPDQPPMAAPAARAYVRDSLEYAAFNKINPRIQSELE